MKEFKLFMFSLLICFLCNNAANASILAEAVFDGKNFTLQRELNYNDKIHTMIGELSDFYYKANITMIISDNEGNIINNYVLDYDYYMAEDFALAPCIIYDSNSKLLTIYAVGIKNVKLEGIKSLRRFYIGSAYIYNFKDNTLLKEEVFSDTVQRGAFPYFMSSTNGNPKLFHYSFDYEKQYSSERQNNGKWSSEPVKDIRIRNAIKEYRNRNILLVLGDNDGKLKTLMSQKSHDRQADKSTEEHIDSNKIKLYPLKFENKYGYINRSGQFIIPPKFETASKFIDGHATVKSNGKDLTIDMTGAFIEPQSAKVLSNGDELTRQSVNLLYGYKNKEGTMIIQPQFNEANPFSEGVARVRFFSEKNREFRDGFIDKQGQLLFELRSNGKASDFHDGLAKVEFGMGREIGFIDKQGNMVIEPRFAVVKDPSEGLSRFNHDGKWGYIDGQGRVAINPRFSALPDDFYDGLAYTEEGYIDRNGTVIANVSTECGANVVKNGNGIVTWPKNIAQICNDHKVMLARQEVERKEAEKQRVARQEAERREAEKQQKYQSTQQKSAAPQQKPTCKIVSQEYDVATGGVPIINYMVEVSGRNDGYIKYEIEHKIYSSLRDLGGTPSLDEALSRYCK